MRILYLGFDINGVGGIATYSRYQIRALRALGHQLHVVSVDKTDKRIVEAGVDRHIAFGDKYRATATVLAYVLRHRRQFDLAVINHVFLAGFGYALKRATGIPYVVNTYNIDILARLSSLRERAFAAADLVIADCQYTIDRIPQFHPHVPPTGLLYDPVDVEFFTPITKSEARAAVATRFDLDLAGKFVIVTVASLLLPPNKGHRQTIEALAQLKDPRLVYLIVGGGPDRDAIAAHAATHGVSDQVKLLGLVPQDALPQLYSAADVAVLVSRGGPGWGEAVPLGLIEANACATTFICGNEDGSVEAIDAARPNGVAIPPLDIAALADQLAAFAAAPERAHAMGRNGKQVVDAVFAFDVFVVKQRALLEPVLARDARGGLRAKAVGKAYRDRIYRHYVEAATTSLAPDTLDGLAPRRPYLADMVARHFPADRAARIVEIGCGHGALLHVAAAAGYTNMAGIDGSPSQVAAAQRLGIDGVRLGEGEAALAEEKDASLDAVVAFDVLEHLDRDELIRMADETFRVLKPGGRWIIHVPNGMAPFAGASRYGDLTHELAFTPDSLAQLVYATGFTALACYEDVPVAHGVKSAVRKIAWLAIRQLLKAYYAIETGTARGAVFTQNLLAVAVK